MEHTHHGQSPRAEPTNDSSDLEAQHRLQPHRVETFKLSRDKRFIEKLHDVVGLYLNPPDKALSFCGREEPDRNVSMILSPW